MGSDRSHHQHLPTTAIPPTPSLQVQAAPNLRKGIYLPLPWMWAGRVTCLDKQKAKKVTFQSVWVKVYRFFSLGALSLEVRVMLSESSGEMFEWPDYSERDPEGWGAILDVPAPANILAE